MSSCCLLIPFVVHKPGLQCGREDWLDCMSLIIVIVLSHFSMGCGAEQYYQMQIDPSFSEVEFNEAVTGTRPVQQL